jgi:hypothetical protein
MKIFGISLFTIILVAAAYYAGSKGLLGKATSTVKSAV